MILQELSSADLITEFDEWIRSTMVDTVTVYSLDKVVFKFRDGSRAERMKSIKLRQDGNRFCLSSFFIFFIKKALVRFLKSRTGFI